MTTFEANTPGARRIVGLLTPDCGARRIVDARAGRLAASAALLLAATAAAAGDARQSLDQVERTAEAFVATQAGGAGAVATKLDRRLNLARCEGPLEAFLRPGARLANRTIVGVRCRGERPWKVYVPVHLAVTGDVLVLSRALPRGHLLEAGDLKRERRDVSRLSGGYARQPSEVLGQRLKHSMRAGSIVTPAALSARILVRRGQSVILRAQNDAIHIRVAGKALMDGALNQRIRVRNVASGRIVEGFVRSAELVEVLVR